MLELVNLSCERDDRVLFTGLSLELLPGQLMQVEGANGTGKTTLLRVLAGLSADFQGEILWQGRKLSSVYADFRLATFYFGHKPAVKSELTPVENILWRASLRNEPCSEQRILAALEQVNLAGYDDVPCGHLSAGQHRRVALTDLALSDSKLWILDEPFTAIDIRGVAWLESVLANHVEQGGMVIITSHQSLSEVSGQVRKVQLEHFAEPVVEYSTDDGGAFL